MSKQVTIRAQTLGGVWETVGADRLRGVWPENDTYSADEWGSSKCSFDLHRDPGAIFPDLSAFTPLEVEIGGVLVWSGRVSETPVREADRVLNVQGLGWQFHLDDDSFAKQWVHTRLTDYKDIRTHPGAALTTFITAPKVTVGNGAIVLVHEANVAVPTSPGYGRGGVYLDLGAGQSARRIVVTYTTSNNDARFALRGGASNSNFGVDDTLITLTNAAASPATSAVSFAQPGRFVSICLQNETGNVVTPTADVWARITAITLVTELAYESGNASVLKASTVVTDALDRGTLLLSKDRSAITVPTFSIPAFGGVEQRTPREFIKAANAVQDWRTKIDVAKRMIFEPKPSVPRIEIGAWHGSEFDSAAENSGEEIYNRVVVEGTGPDGEKLSVQRTAAQQSGVALEVPPSPSLANPSFAVDTAGWTPSTGTTITRDTVVFDTSPASGRWERSGGLLTNDKLTVTFTGTFLAGVPYTLLFAARSSGGTPVVSYDFGDPLDSSADFIQLGTTFATFAVTWTPTSNRTAGRFFLDYYTSPAANIYIDSLLVLTPKPTLVDRRDFRRTHVLPVKSDLTVALGQQIGDVWLAAHKTTPLKGTVKITGDQATREILTGAGVPPERLLTMTGDLLRLAHRVDPDTGGQGRDGRLAEVTYKPAEDTADAVIDNRRTSHEALLERLAVVVGGAG